MAELIKIEDGMEKGGTAIGANFDQIQALLDAEEAFGTKLWNGNDLMGSSAGITPSKALSQCAHGWKVLLSYADGTGAGQASNWQILEIPRDMPELLTGGMTKLLGTGDASHTGRKYLQISDTQIKGYGHNTDTENNSFAVRAVYEY